MRAQLVTVLHEHYVAELADLNDLLKAVDTYNPPRSIVDWVEKVEDLVTRTKRTNNALRDIYSQAIEALPDNSHAAKEDKMYLGKILGQLKRYYELLEELELGISQFFSITRTVEPVNMDDDTKVSNAELKMLMCVARRLRLQESHARSDAAPSDHTTAEEEPTVSLE
jgi:hypothetical protein